MSVGRYGTVNRVLIQDLLIVVHPKELCCQRGLSLNIISAFIGSA